MSTALICSSTVAPLQAEASLRSEQVSQLLYGRVADVSVTQGQWRRVKVRSDGYEGWINVGYCGEVDTPEADSWEKEAQGWSAPACRRPRRSPRGSPSGCSR